MVIKNGYGIFARQISFSGCKEQRIVTGAVCEKSSGRETKNGWTRGGKMSKTFKYIVVFGIITTLMVGFVVSSISYIETPRPAQKPTSEIKEFFYDNSSVRCFYIDTNGIKSYLSCVQVESQTVLK